MLFLNGPDARNELVLRDLPATAAVQSWTSYDLLKVFPAGFAWSAGLLTQEESAQLWPGFDASPSPCLRYRKMTYSSMR